MIMNPKISFISCINNKETYEACVIQSLKNSQKDFELVPIFNENGRYSAASALNEGARLSGGDILVFSHQDVEFSKSWTRKLMSSIKIIESSNERWGVLGLMGVQPNGFFAGHIYDPHTNKRYGSLPSKVSSVDELCLVLKRSNFLPFDEGLKGFHLYGADISLQYLSKGFYTYAIDAPAVHHSGGTIDNSFNLASLKLTEKWSSKKSPRFIETTCKIIALDKRITTKIILRIANVRRSIVRRLQKRHKSYEQ